MNKIIKYFLIGSLAFNFSCSLPYVQKTRANNNEICEIVKNNLDEFREEVKRKYGNNFDVVMNDYYNTSERDARERVYRKSIKRSGFSEAKEFIPCRKYFNGIEAIKFILIYKTSP